MTLRELCKQVRGKKAAGNLNRSQLLARHEGLVARHDATLGNGAIKVSVKVYESGYVLYEEDDRYTVFHLDDLRNKNWNYEGVSSECEGCCDGLVRNDVIMSEDWSMGLTLEGNDRIMYNRVKKESDHVEFSYSGISEDLASLGIEINFTKNMEDEVDREKRGKVFEKLSKEMSPAQWTTYCLIHCRGLKHKDAAKILGVSEPAVCKNYKKACEVVVRFRDRLKKDFYEN
ncbi:MAG: sigma-70 family RNA polymerase sigma factor [Lachnospiraceae bacterium]|nr:sigma-70 family RNA polymerase sigma factor [Lachnospiraceae bacterium]